MVYRPPRWFVDALKRCELQIHRPIKRSASLEEVHDLGLPPCVAVKQFLLLAVYHPLAFERVPVFLGLRCERDDVHDVPLRDGVAHDVLEVW